MRLTSPSFADGEQIPSRHTIEGQNSSPPLQIAEVPEGTRSLALIVEDIDSPIGPFTHWLVWNIAPDTTRIEENAPPAEAERGINGFGEVRYSGPCPPSGRHRYRFRLIALDSMLEATTPDRKDHLIHEMDGNIIAETTLTGYFDARD